MQDWMATNSGLIGPKGRTFRHQGGGAGNFGTSSLKKKIMKTSIEKNKIMWLPIIHAL